MARTTLAPEATRTWHLVAEVNQGPAEVAALTAMLQEGGDLRARLEADMKDGRVRLEKLVAESDGLQCTADTAMTARHYYNVLFNIMRGGVFVDNHQISRADLRAFVGTRIFLLEVQARPHPDNVWPAPITDASVTFSAWIV